MVETHRVELCKPSLLPGSAMGHFVQHAWTGSRQPCITVPAGLEYAQRFATGPIQLVVMHLILTSTPASAIRTATRDCALSSSTPACPLSNRQSSPWKQHVFRGKLVFSGSSTTRAWSRTRSHPARPLSHDAWSFAFGLIPISRR